MQSLMEGRLAVAARLSWKAGGIQRMHTGRHWGRVGIGLEEGRQAGLCDSQA
jgi:hypothetical protein